jgi:hypothetical protein
VTDHRTAMRRRDERLRTLGELLGEALTVPTANDLPDDVRSAAHRLAGGGALLGARADWTHDILRAAVVCTLLARTDPTPETLAHLRETLLADTRSRLPA